MLHLRIPENIPTFVPVFTTIAAFTLQIDNPQNNV
jgi:hypothetical protein